MGTTGGRGREWEVQTAAQLTGSGNRVPGVRLQSGERHGSWSRHQRPAILSYCGFKSDFFSKAPFSLSQFREKKRETKEEGRWRGRVSVPSVQ